VRQRLVNGLRSRLILMLGVGKLVGAGGRKTSRPATRDGGHCLGTLMETAARRRRIHRCKIGGHVRPAGICR